MNHLPSIPHSLRLLISGGDVLRGSYIDHLLDQVVIYNTYGPSETTVCASYFKVNGNQVLEDGTYPIGKAVLGSHIDLWDDQDHHVKDGEVGEIIISGDGVSLGYIGNHSQENKAFEKKKERLTTIRAILDTSSRMGILRFYIAKTTKS